MILPNWKLVAAPCLAVVAGVLVIRHWVSVSQSIDKHRQRIAVLETEVYDASVKAHNANISADEYRDLWEAEHSKTKKLKADLSRMVIKPPDIRPAENLDAAKSELVKLGIGPVVLPDMLGLTLNDVNTAIRWGKTSSVVGPMADKIVALEGVVNNQDLEIALLKGEANSRLTAYTESQRQVSALQEIVSAERMVARNKSMSMTYKWVTISGAALVTGYLIGKAR